MRFESGTVIGKGYGKRFLVSIVFCDFQVFAVVTRKEIDNLIHVYFLTGVIPFRSELTYVGITIKF